MKAYFPAPAKDPRLAYEWLRPDGSRYGDYYYGIAEAFEMLAMSRWHFGWLNEPQVRCVTEPEATITLGPIAAPGDRTAMAAIPLSETEVIVIESRKSSVTTHTTGTSPGMTCAPAGRGSPACRPVCPPYWRKASWFTPSTPLLAMANSPSK